MGRFDRRDSRKMRRRTAQRKKKVRAARQAEEVRTERQAARGGKGKAKGTSAKES
jgi:hypothetical protein